MGLLISRPSVFVWGPEACLSTVFVVFVERRALYEGKKHICGNENSITRNLYFSCVPFSPSDKYEIRIYGRVDIRICFYYGCNC